MRSFIQRVIGHYKQLEEYWFCYNCGKRNPRDTDVCGNCGEKLVLRLSVEPIGGNQIRESDMVRQTLKEGQMMKPEMGNKGLKFFGKVFLHGVLLTFLNIVFYLGWAVATLILVSLGSLIGLAIAVGLLFLGVGWINMFLGFQLWNIEANTSFWNIFFHGLVLFVILLFVGLITSFLPNQIFPGVTTYAVSIVITSLLYGLIAKRVAEWFG